MDDHNCQVGGCFIANDAGASAAVCAGANYFQSVTPRLSAGGEFFWLASSLKSGVGLAARYTDDKQIFTTQLATTGLLNMQYANKVTDKVSGGLTER